VLSERSLKALENVHEDLVALATEASKHIEITIICGYRSIKEQRELFKRGRKLVDGIWRVVNPHEVVTYVDGYQRLSMHNHSPSLAVDMVPFNDEPLHIDWSDTFRFARMGGFIWGLAQEFLSSSTIVWGGNWEGFRDMTHFEIRPATL